MDGRRRRSSRRHDVGRVPRWGTQIRVWLCAKGLRANAELAALARARRDVDAVRHSLNRARNLLTAARRAAADASAITPNAEAGSPWPRRSTSVSAAFHGPSRGRRQQTRGTGSSARPSSPTAAGARPRRSSPPVRPAPRRVYRSGMPMPSATRLGAKPLADELALLALRARLDLASRDEASADREQRLGDELGLTPRESEVLDSHRPWPDQPRDRRDPCHQCQDGQRPRLTHPAQARRHPTGRRRPRSLTASPPRTAVPAKAIRDGFALRYRGSVGWPPKPAEQSGGRGEQCRAMLLMS